jgi:hypothetical protein
MSAPTCFKCQQPMIVVRRGPALFLSCATGCKHTPVWLDGRTGRAWTALVADNGRLTVIAVGPEAACWDEMLRCRRAGQLCIVAPVAGSGEAV